MKKSLVPVVLLLVAWGLMPGLVDRVRPVQAQTERRVVYLVTYADETYTLLALDPIDGRQETLLTVPGRVRDGLPDLIPTSEIDALNRYLPEYNASSPYPIASLADLSMDARVSGIAASPDNQQVIIAVKFQHCFDRRYSYCYGTTQLILIDRALHTQQVLFSLGLHDTQYLPLDYVDPDPDVNIGGMQWTPNQEAIIVESSNWPIARNGGDSAIIIVPVNGDPPIKIGEGQTWATRPDENQIVILSNYNHMPNGVTNTLNFVDVDLATGQYSETSCVLEHYFIHDRAGMAFPGPFVVFQNSFDPTVFIEQDGGLAVFDTPYREATLVLPDQFFREIQGSPDGAHLVLESRDSLLVEAHYEGGVMHLSPLTATPVTDWQLGSAGDLLVKFAEGEPYHWLDAEGVPVTSSVEIKAPYGSELRAIDW